MGNPAIDATSATIFGANGNRRQGADYWSHVAIALAIVVPYTWDAAIGLFAYYDRVIYSLTSVILDAAVIALAILLVRGRILVAPLLVIVAIAGLQSRWSILTSVWFWLPHMDGRRTLVLTTTAANLVTVLGLAVPLVWRSLHWGFARARPSRT
jgi:hypothetical protein